MLSADVIQGFSYQQACPACGLHLAFRFHEGHNQPLATLGWPATSEAARNMEQLPLDFVRCVQCGHIYNRAFDYQKVPYVLNPNRMYNQSQLWQEHLNNICERIQRGLPQGATIVEIGCGEGLLLLALAQYRPDLKLIGFDPNSSPRTLSETITLRAELFDAAIHLPEYHPDLLISRHVLEHLMNPRAFLQYLQLACTFHQQRPLLFIEVPCIDQALADGRLEDFYYEHNSHFTRRSFQHLLQQACDPILFTEVGYGEEVIWGMGQLALQPEWLAHAEAAWLFSEQAKETQTRMSAALDELAQQNEAVIIWGGTGKSATFINTFGADRQRFPWVVDSDLGKVGTFVPGMGQAIHAPALLHTLEPAIILITTQWRAHDIVKEISAQQLPYQRILVLHEGRLVDYPA